MSGITSVLQSKSLIEGPFVIITYSMKSGLFLFSGGGEILPPEPGLLLPLFFSDSCVSILARESPKLPPLVLPTLGILPRFWDGGGRGDMRPSLVGEGERETSESLVLFLLEGSILSAFTAVFSFSSLDLELLLLLDLELLLLLELWLLDLELFEELDFLESDLLVEDFLEGLLSFFSLHALTVSSLMIGGAGAVTSCFFSALTSFLSSVLFFLLGSLLLGSLDSLFSDLLSDLAST